MKRQLTTADFDAFVAGEAIGIDPEEIVAQYVAGLTPPVEQVGLEAIGAIAPIGFIPICEDCLQGDHRHDEDGCYGNVVNPPGVPESTIYFCRCEVDG